MRSKQMEKFLSTLVALLMAMSFLLTACSSSEKTNTSIKENSEQAEIPNRK